MKTTASLWHYVQEGVCDAPQLYSTPIRERELILQNLIKSVVHFIAKTLFQSMLTQTIPTTARPRQNDFFIINSFTLTVSQI